MTFHTVMLVNYLRRSASPRITPSPIRRVGIHSTSVASTSPVLRVISIAPVFTQRHSPFLSNICITLSPRPIASLFPTNLSRRQFSTPQAFPSPPHSSQHIPKNERLRVFLLVRVSAPVRFYRKLTFRQTRHPETPLYSFGQSLPHAPRFSARCTAR